MPLFADAAKFGGEFYREFNQSLGADDLEKYFGEFLVAMGSASEAGGVCAGCCYHWIRHYLTFPGRLYSNRIMRRAKREIMTVQLWVREKDCSLAELLILSGMALDGYSVVVTEEEQFLGVAKTINSVPGIYLLSYGGHVVVSFVDAGSGRTYFLDVHKGDVWLPNGGGVEWFERYLQIMSKHGPIIVTGFAPVWPTQKAATKMLEMRQDLGKSKTPRIAADWETANPPLADHFPIM